MKWVWWLGLSVCVWGGEYINTLGMRFREIPSGSFMMGSQSAPCESPRHWVKMERFYMQESEVTQEQYQALMGNNPSFFKGRPNAPVEQVTWDEAQMFVQRLNAKERTHLYALPSEAQWEYAARAGSTTRFVCGSMESCLSHVAVFDTNQSATIRSKQPNRWGLYDMYGNVWEWTEDCWSDHYQAPKECHYRIIRGGAWSFEAETLHATARDGSEHTFRSYSQGFRLIRKR